MELRKGPAVSAEANGGGTNPYGDYFVYKFPAEVLPADACEQLLVAPQTNPSPRNKAKVCRRNIPGNWTEVVSQAYLLGPADAVVVHLCTPPPAAYFSLDAYIGSRYLPGEAAFSPGTNYGDAVNMCSLNLPTDDEERAGKKTKRTKKPSERWDTSAAADEPAVIIQTADGGAAAAVAAALASDAVGVNPFRVTTHALNASALRLWNRSAAAGGASWAASRPDLLFSVFRASVYDDGQQGGARGRYQNESWPVTFFFAADDAKAAEPLAPALAPRDVADLPTAALCDATQLPAPLFCSLLSCWL